MESFGDLAGRMEAPWVQTGERENEVERHKRSFWGPARDVAGNKLGKNPPGDCKVLGDWSSLHL